MKVRLSIVWLVLVLILGGMVVSTFLVHLSWRERMETDLSQQRPHFEEFSSILDTLGDTDALESFEGNLLLPAGSAGEWDEHIREIGNIVYDREAGRYLFAYSGHTGQYTQTNVYIGMAWSPDGQQWHKVGRALESAAEDPYLVKHDGKLYMFFEDKSEVPSTKIDLAISDDGHQWQIHGRGVVRPSEEGWQSKDVSSPVVVQAETGWVMLYEGRGPGNYGKMGYAISTDLVYWHQETEPVFEGHDPDAWDHWVVPDDVVRDGKSFLLTYHGGGRAPGWASGIALSEDLRRWRRANSFPIHPADTLMVAPVGSTTYLAAASEIGVELYVPLRGIE